MNIFFNNICKDYEGKIVFNGIKGKINSGDKLGIIGANGIGKSTLAKILVGEEHFEKGELSYSPLNLRVMYLYPEVDEEGSVKSHLENFLKTDISKLDMEEVLSKLNCNGDMLNYDMSKLSGGEKTKVMLLKAYLSSCDIMILDEPTNHLDIETTDFLQKFLQDRTFVVISHDRYFLDKVCNKIWYMNRGVINEYCGNYSKFVELKEIEDRENQKEYSKQQKKIEELEEMIEDRKEWYAKAHKDAGQNDFQRAKAKKHVSVMRNKEKQLERLLENKVEKPEKQLSPCFNIINKSVMNLKLPRYILQAKGLTKEFSERKIFENISFEILKGDKVGLIGVNGSGKTTLLKMIIGEDKNYSGKITINPSIKIAYLSQSLDTLKFEETILENVLCNDITEREARLFLSTLLFKGDDVFKKIKDLSMGEKVRVAFCNLILSGGNMLIMDEPTNYLDMPSREKMEQVLKEFKGAVIFVSHDRYFINNVATRIFDLKEGKILSYNCGYEEYLQKINSANKDQNKENELMRLNLELAFISGKLGEIGISEEEKDDFNNKFIEVYKQIAQLSR